MTRASDLAKLLGAGATILDGTTITTSDNTEQLSLVSTDADASIGPILRMDRQSASAADGDLLGKVNFVGHNDAGTPEDISYASITGIINDASDGTEDGKIAINTIVAGTEKSRIFIDAGETVFNEESADLDFRVESNGNTHMLFVEGGTDKVGISTSSPASLLTVGGNANTTAKPTVAITDTTNGATMSMRGQSPKLAFDVTSSGVPKILMDGAGIEFKDGTLDSEGNVDVKIESSGNITVTDGSISSGVTHTFSLFGATGTGGSANYVTYSFVGDPNTGMFSGTADTLKFATGGSERMRITSAGTMTMGTTSSLTDVGGITLRKDTQGGYSTLLFLQNQPGTGGTMGADIHMGYASDYGSILRFYGNPFNSRPGGFQFRRVTGSGSSDLSMQIGTDGAVIMPDVYNDTTGSGANVNISSAGQLQRSTSSLRYKNTVNDATHGLTELLTLRPVTYKGNNDGDTVFGGLIAEEVHDAGLTEFVTYNDDGEPDALAYGNMVSLCIKAIQELKTELDEAKARITELETA